MTPREEIHRFIEAAKANGISDDTVASLLEAGGWSKKQIFDAIRDHYEGIAGVPVPVRRGWSENSRDTFLHLLAFGTLSTWIIALGAILIAAVEHAFPDPVMIRNSYYVRQSLAASLASLLVAFPLYLLATRQIFRDIAENPEKKDSGVRRWLTWLALLIAASVVIGDVITVVTWLLRGEITIRFLLKATVIVALAGGVFWFYLRSLREGGARAGIFSLVAAGFVLVGLISGFNVLGPPSAQRELEADRLRVQHLKEISKLLQSRTDLPDDLSQLPLKRSDPVSDQPYEYRKLGRTQYELCSVFNFADHHASFWTHTAGRHCFSLDSSRQLPSY